MTPMYRFRTTVLHNDAVFMGPFVYPNERLALIKAQHIVNWHMRAKERKLPTIIIEVVEVTKYPPIAVYMKDTFDFDSWLDRCLRGWDNLKKKKLKGGEKYGRRDA